MKTPQILLFLLTLVSSIHALTIPSYADASHLFKRKGGGGGGGRGGGGFSSGGGSRGSSSSGGSRGSSSSGGRTAGIGPQPRTFGSGAYYGGGSASAYGAGKRTPGGLAPVALGAGGLAFLGVGALAYSSYYYYPYNHYWYYHNNTANENQTRPVSCYCGEGTQCGCEYRNDTDYVNAIANNQSIAQVADVNGTQTLVVNGTLPPDTQAAGNAAARMGQMGGWAVIGGAVAWGIWLL